MTLLTISILYTALAFGFYAWLQRSAVLYPEDWEEPIGIDADPNASQSAQKWPPYPNGHAA